MTMKKPNITERELVWKFDEFNTVVFVFARSFFFSQADEIKRVVKRASNHLILSDNLFHHP